MVLVRWANGLDEARAHFISVRDYYIGCPEFVVHQSQQNLIVMYAGMFGAW